MAKQRRPDPPPEQQAHVTVLEEWLEEAWQWLKAYGHWVAVGVAIGAVIVAFYQWRSRAAENKLQEGWIAFYAAADKQDLAQRVDALRAVTQDHADAVLVSFCLQQIGDAQLSQAMNAPPEQRGKLFTEAQSTYQSVVDRFADQRLPAANARLGLGLVFENTGQWTLAQQTYDQLVKDTALQGNPVQLLAGQRLNALADYKIPLVVAPPPPPATQSASAPADEPASSPASAPASQPAN